MSVIETRPLNSFRVLSPRELEIHIKGPNKGYPACRLAEAVFWRHADPDVYYGEPYTPENFTGDNSPQKGYTQWEYVAGLKQDGSATARMIVEHVDLIPDSSRPRSDQMSVMVGIIPVDIYSIMHEGWSVMERFDPRRIFTVVGIRALDYLDRLGRRHSSVEVFPGFAGTMLDKNGQKVEAPVHFRMGTEDNSFYGGGSLNHALILTIAGEVGNGWLRLQQQHRV